MGQEASVDRMRDILNDALEIVTGSRHKAYGSPDENHARTAQFWSVYIQSMDGRSFDGRDVAMLNILQKISRDLHWRQRDNCLDIIGYAANAEVCM